MATAPWAERPAHVPPERVVDFDVYNADWSTDGYHEFFARLQADGMPDLVWTPRNEGHWIATRGELIWDIFPNHADFSNHLVIVPKSVGLQDRRVPSTLDPPDHKHFRSLMDAGMGPQKIRQIEPLIRETAVRLIEGFRADGHCDFTRQYAEELPIRVFLGIVDLPLSDVDELKYWARQIVHPDGETTFEVAAKWFHDYMEPVIDARLGGDGQDLISTMINGNVYGRALTRTEMHNLSLQALLGGLDTVVNFLGFVMLDLAGDPQLRRRLASDPKAIGPAIDEFARRHAVVNVARWINRDLVCDGVELKEGEVIMLPTVLVGMDERVNACPFTIDIDRRNSRNAAFGRGPHFCPGAHLARAETRITLEEWLARIPEFELAASAELRFRSGIVGTVKGVEVKWETAAV
jgi:cytochrome P450